MIVKHKSSGKMLRMIEVAANKCYSEEVENILDLWTPKRFESWRLRNVKEGESDNLYRVVATKSHAASIAADLMRKEVSFVIYS